MNEFLEDVGKRLGGSGEKHSELNFAPCWGSAERNVEIALTNFLARQWQLHGRVELGCKHKDDAISSMALQTAMGQFEIEPRAARLRRAALRGAARLTMLGTLRPVPARTNAAAVDIEDERHRRLCRRCRDGWSDLGKFHLAHWRAWRDGAVI